MAAIEDLLDQIPDPMLRTKLVQELGRLKARKHFGLVFEEHTPELVRLPAISPQVGSRVLRRDDGTIFRVASYADGDGVEIVPETGGAGQVVARSDLITVKVFGEPMYPALTPIDSIDRSDCKPWHTIINAENYHALQLLLYGHEGQFDLIYIDPPYNTGARDWKYNNDYVDKKDLYRHSKWLSMMRRRLLLAKRLLRTDGVLIVTIDEHEVHHLGVLLEDNFQDFARQMVTIVTNPKGIAQGRLSRVEEHAFFCFGPDAVVPPQSDDLLAPDRPDQKRFRTPRWEWLLRGGAGSRREERKYMFYPIYIDPEVPRISEIGDPLPLEQQPTFDGAGRVAWPIRGDGALGRWRVSPATLRSYLEKGYVKLGGYDAKRNAWTVLTCPRQ